MHDQEWQKQVLHHCMGKEIETVHACGTAMTLKHNIVDSENAEMPTKLI